MMQQVLQDAQCFSCYCCTDIYLVGPVEFLIRSDSQEVDGGLNNDNVIECQWLTAILVGDGPCLAILCLLFAYFFTLYSHRVI